jgi:demethylmenaquinone methyltransferase/2-methoxy-6-polyprenyl-1,4-benzoquinol methylase
MDEAGMTSKEWLEVIEAMEDVSPYYERVNALMTFGLADKWRREVAAAAGPDDVVLEIGSGPGNFARHLASKKVFCLEPSGELISSSRKTLDPEKVTPIRGVGENIPLADSSVDKVFCVFSFRDFFDRGAGVSEMHRVLKEGGEVRIVDVAKPPPGPYARLIDMHIKHVVPKLARVAVPPAVRTAWKRDPYRTFARTYEAFGFTTVYEDLLTRNGFDQVGTEFLKMRGATVTRGKKPWRSTS